MYGNILLLRTGEINPEVNGGLNGNVDGKAISFAWTGGSYPTIRDLLEAFLEGLRTVLGEGYSFTARVNSQMCSVMVTSPDPFDVDIKFAHTESGTEHGTVELPQSSSATVVLPYPTVRGRVSISYTSNS